VKALFIKLFEPFLATFVASLHAMNNDKRAPSTARDPSALWNFAKAFEGWDKVFDKLLKGIEEKAAQVTEANMALVPYVHALCRNASPDSGLLRTSNRVSLVPPWTISVHVRFRFYPFSLSDVFCLVVPSESPNVPQDEQQIARNVQALKDRLRGRGGRRGGRGMSRVESGSGRDGIPTSE